MTGFFHFYDGWNFWLSDPQNGVNALWRAFFISTLTSKIAWFYAAFQPHFPRYFSEYSEKSGFPTIFLAVYNLFIFSSEFLKKGIIHLSYPHCFFRYNRSHDVAFIGQMLTALIWLSEWISVNTKPNTSIRALCRQIRQHPVHTAGFPSFQCSPISYHIMV